MTSGERQVECERLAEALRGLRSRTGLSLAALAAKTPYSKSSWERYLNGRTVPPRQAVEELCELAGEPPGRPLALWELADTVSSGRAAGVRPVAGPPSPARVGVLPPGGGRSSRLPGRGLLAAAAGGLAAVAIVVPLAATGAFDTSGPDPAPSSRTALAKACQGSSCTGKDPETYVCGADPVPVTLGRRDFPGPPTVVKIRRSTACGAVWARIDLGRVGDRAEILVPGQAPRRIEVKDQVDATDSLSTPMVAATGSELAHVRACLVRDGERHCFGTGPHGGSHVVGG
ncbi:helix-turn-helix domain-containing protein [Streptomyces sp. NPDC086033]|uniref:helix-turn-helix domain-containing protein n=1 Tax=Streptomyces sp. NPDC086033 TaxID=3365747 RepID=UPI0037D0842E